MSSASFKFVLNVINMRFLIPDNVSPLSWGSFVVRWIFENHSDNVSFTFSSWNNNQRWEYDFICRLCGRKSLHEQFIVDATNENFSLISGVFVNCLSFDWDFCVEFEKGSEKFLFTVLDGVLEIRSENMVLVSEVLIEEFGFECI